VTQVTTSDGYVQASYTAGYMGAFVMGVGVSAVIAGGTGYYYPPYYAYPAYGYPAYHPYPATYGAVPYYNSATGAYGVSQTAYGPYGSATRTASYNPYTGTYARTASASTPYGSAAVGQAYNPYTGAYGATKQGSNAYSQWGSSVVSKGGETAYTQHYSTAQGTVGSVQTSSGGKAAGVSTAYGTTAAGKTASGNMYAGHPSVRAEANRCRGCNRSRRTGKGVSNRASVSINFSGLVAREVLAVAGSAGEAEVAVVVRDFRRTAFSVIGNQ